MKYLSMMAAAIAICGASAASALTVDLDFQGTWAREGNIDVRDVNDNDPRYSGVAAGFKMRVTHVNDELIAPGFDFVGWCLDLGTTIRDAGYEVFTKADTVFTNAGSAVLLNTVQKEAIQSLFDTVYATVTDNLDLKKFSGGFQLALWEIVYEEDAGTAGYNLGTGRFQDLAGAPSSRTAAFNYANEILANLGDDNTAIDTYKLFFLEADEKRDGTGHKSQNLVAGFTRATPLGDGPSPVPVPAAGLLLVGALGGLGLGARRRRRA